MSLSILPGHLNNQLARYLGLVDYGNLQQTNSHLHRDYNRSDFILGIAEGLELQLQQNNNLPFLMTGGIDWIFNQLQEFANNTEIRVSLRQTMVTMIYQNAVNRHQLLQKPIIPLIQNWLSTELSHKIFTPLIHLLSQLVLDNQLKMQLKTPFYSDLFKHIEKYSSDEKVIRSTLHFMIHACHTRPKLIDSSKEILLTTGGVQYAWKCLHTENLNSDIHLFACQALYKLYDKSPSNQKHFVESLDSLNNLKELVKRSYQYINQTSFIRVSQSLLHVLYNSTIGKGEIHSARNIVSLYKKTVSNLCEKQLQVVVEIASQSDRCQGQINRLVPMILNLISQSRPSSYQNVSYLQSLVTIFQNQMGSIGTYNWVVGAIESLIHSSTTRHLFQQLGLRLALEDTYADLLQKSGNHLLLLPLSNLLMNLTG